MAQRSYQSSQMGSQSSLSYASLFINNIKGNCIYSLVYVGDIIVITDITELKFFQVVELIHTLIDLL
ncbi:Integrase, catalytic core [Gossypium australe]|uniref:Integrase, catalytic core n=1 Tax=Gossypium australe TaxID=47621 RepID=A0A5B6V8E9_9ROSI|nr:Integrase, catalytic core [Gossypium australe]